MRSARLQNVLMTCSLFLGSVLGAKLRPRASYAVKESHHVPRQWTNLGPAPGQHMIELQIGLKPGNFDVLERHLFEVSNPAHARYGQHLSADEINNLVRPSPAAATGVHEWLCDHGIKEGDFQYSPARDWVKIAIPIESAERLLETNYFIYRHEDGTHLIRTSQWSLPLHLHEHIETIQPTNSFLRPLAMKSTLMIAPVDNGASRPQIPAQNAKLTAREACNASLVTTQCLRTLYGTLDYTTQSTDNNRIALANYLGETSNRSDINIFLSQYRPEAAPASQTFTVQTVAGAIDQQSPNNASQLDAGTGLEGNLDAETILGIAFPTPMTVYNTAGSPPFQPDAATPSNNNEPYLDWLQFVLAQENLPQVISNSYGDDEQTVPQSYANAVCKGFAQLGARGVTVLFSSGDNGVGAQGKCFTNDGKNASSFLPAFPAGCPYVTTVGGTRGIEPEVVAFNPLNRYASGGGFSNYFARPSYQDDVVPPYIASLNGEFEGLYNTSGRAYPDISAQGYHFATIWNGSLAVLDGTSASAPAAAAIIALVNDALLAAGKPVMGFMNPWLYSVGFQAFTDVLNGSAIGCNTTGFPAAEGWDAVTGFGTPLFPKVKAAALNDGIW